MLPFAAGALVASCLALGACAEGVELNGKIFDMMGVSGSSADRADPKMADRAPLVLPPNTNRLPEPGSGKAISDEVAAINDPEQRKAAAAKERERLHLAYCRGDLQWKDKALNPQTSVAKSPYGPCPTLFGTVLGKGNNNSNNSQ
jgi:hypothetical protein